MTAKPRIVLAPLENTTSFAPLVALGFWARELDLWAAIHSRVRFPESIQIEHPVEALLDLWVSMHAGCRSVSHVNTRIRPDRPLAQAWGRPCFYEQSTLARVLDRCPPQQVAQLRAGVEAIYRWIGQAPHHRWSAEPLTLDIDLTGLPAGRQAEGSTTGYFSGKRGPEAGKCAALAPPATTRACRRCSIQATPSVSTCSRMRCGAWKACCG
jgi:hypothetical protein